MRKLVIALGVATMMVAGGYEVAAQVMPAMAKPAILPAEPIDYGNSANWLCRPDIAGDACRVDLDSMQVNGRGERKLQPFKPAIDPGIDCFYVYPTVSNDRTMYSDMVPDNAEKTVVVAQAARFASQCRVFAPVYRQFTLPALIWAMSGGGLPTDPRNYDDVKAAWNWYLEHENKGRGVVLIGHSQGSILLRQLMREEIDGKPIQRRLVSALLAGNLDLTVKKGRDRGGSFQSIPLCRREGQTGCVVAWSTYPETAPATRMFGSSTDGGKLVGACVNPAALSGGRGKLKTYMRKPSMAPAGDPPFVEATGQLTAECVTDEAGSTLRVRVEETPLKPLIEKYVVVERAGPSWGVHSKDINLVEGNLLDVVEAQARRWTRR
ncbi:DUF3089 domain-containing protein [Sphingomonas naphthae]|uniref:DUF3089 domain-containing protein n=1 Tax=Sphingomonas naphthae TaxID=1813468 RepID=A0ABY7THT4_9SPHN|nr:DUF3089 domain-containing protein [Sphingomonas naphthae]WCT72282.1 DUF3089 domain-containing protein [Sphingomonas naphthae]